MMFSRWNIVKQVQKAVSYCVHDQRLLVFRHLDFPIEETGLQVPAGSVQDGETPEAAALRETSEETGMDAFELVRLLGRNTYDMRPYRDEVQERWFFHLRPTTQLPAKWFSLEMHDGTGEPTRLECFWIPISHGHVLAGGQGAFLWALERAQG